MQISLNLTNPINIKTNKLNTNSQNRNTNISANITKSIQPTPTFCGYKSIIIANSKRTILRTEDLKQMFSDIFNLIDKNADIKKTDYFYTIKDLFKQKGLRATLAQLGDPNQKGALGKFVADAREYDLTLASDNSKPIFFIHSNGPYGLLNTLADTKTAQRQIILHFQDPSNQYQLGFSLTKNGEFELRKCNDTYNSYTSYHKTGNRKKETIQNHLGNPDTTYYNKDGSKSFFKNLLFGGEATPIY